MANKTSTEKCGTQLKKGKAQEAQTKLADKLQLDLERDLLRLFQESIYCDIKLTVDSSSVLTHSCILKTRAYRFYKFIYAEFEVLNQNGLSIFNIYNASFTYLQSFVENVYTNIHTSEAEDCIIKHLQETKTHSYIRTNLDSSDSVKSVITPESDLFFTPKSSPSELQKAFVPSTLKIKDNDVVSYYKIVSVDDIPIDEKLESGKRKEEKDIKEEEKALEKELAEQDELLSSFKTIFLKKDKAKPNTLSLGNSSQSTKKFTPKFNRKFDANVLLWEDQDKGKIKAPLWKLKPANESYYRSEKQTITKISKKILSVQSQQCNIFQGKVQDKFAVNSGADIEEVTNSLCSSDMDVSTTGGDSGLDNSSICLPEISPRENTTVSETSGVDLTEAAINEEIPNDETISTKQPGSTGSSVSSEVGTWDANDEYKKSPVNGNVNSADESLNVSDNPITDDNSEENEVPGRNHLTQEEIARLDEMDKNIRDCQVFLCMERQVSNSYEPDKSNHSEQVAEVAVKVQKIEETILDNNLDDTHYELPEKEAGYHYADLEGNHMNNPEVLLHRQNDHRLNSDEGNYYAFNTCNNAKNVEDDDDDLGSCENVNNNVNLMNENYEVVDANESIKEGASNDIITNEEYYEEQPDVNLKRVEIQETRTPPCTPKKLKMERQPELDGEKREELSEVSSNQWEHNNSSGVSNYFIDASSLLDEDEIISPPISLINFKPLQCCDDEGDRKSEDADEERQVTRKVVTNFFSPENETLFDRRENERRQGEIIFKNSIPHFSKHEVEENLLQEIDEPASERLRGGADHLDAKGVDDESEQVVPSADLPMDAHDFECAHSNLASDGEPDSGFSVESYFYNPVPSKSANQSPEETDEIVDGSQRGVNNGSQADISRGGFVQDVSSSSVCSGSPNTRRRNEAAPILSGGIDPVFDDVEEKVQRKPSQTQSEAWVVTFDDINRKGKNRFVTSSESDLESNGEDRRTPPVHKSIRELRQANRNEPSVEFFVDIREKREVGSREEAKEEPKPYPVEKSSSFGYFLDFGKTESEPVPQKEEKQEKKNMFSMFIGMDGGEAKPRKPKPTLDKERTFDKSIEEPDTQSPSGKSSLVESSDDVKKPFYMFIESDSPNVKRKQIPKKQVKPNIAEPEPVVENSTGKNYTRAQSYSIERHHPDDKEATGREVKTDFECSSSENSLPYGETEHKTTKKGKLPLPINKFRGLSNETKITAWSETKVPKDGTVSSESWLRTKDIQVNYTGKSDDYNNKDVNLKKDSTFIMGNEYKPRESNRRSYKSLKDGSEAYSKPSERDSGVVLSDKGEDTFVKLSDMDRLGNLRAKPSKDRMSRSITESGNKKTVTNGEIPLSKSIGSEGKVSSAASAALYDKQVNKSLSRLFPNLSAHSLAGFSSRKDGDGDVQMSETSEVSSSMQSSVEPSALEMSTSETDVSSHVGISSRLGEDLLKMFLEEISPDVIVEVGGRRIKAHKCILSSRCQYFAAMLSGGWVESAGNVISLQGFSYNAVHFALRHIYSGESRIPESLNIVELATLADMLCLDGLQEIISYNLKVKYCHSFHVPCSVCSVGVTDCLPIAAAYGLDDLYRKCLRWITKYFVKLWPTKNFGSLPKELLEKCYQHYVVHMTVENVLDTIVNVDKVRGSLPNVRWAEPVSRLVNKLHDATVRYIAEHFSSVLTSDNFLALGKEAGWNVSRLEDSLIETIKFLPPEQACWSHARLHRILSVATGPDPPPEMDWNENFLKLLQLIAELVENSLIKQAPRAAKSKAWRQMEPELRSRIQEAACLVLQDDEPPPTYRRSNHVRREFSQPNIPQTAKSRNLEIRQIKLAMSQQAHRNPNTSRPLSLQIDQRPKKDSRFVPLRPSASTSSVRRSEPIEVIRKTQSRSQILGSTTLSEPKKNLNPKYSEVKSRYLEPRSPQKNLQAKPTGNTNQRRTFRYISSSDSSRNCSPALRPSNSKTSVPQSRKSTGATRANRNSVISSDSTATFNGKRDRSYVSTRSDTPSARTLSRLTAEENMSTDSLCTDSLISEKDATLKRKTQEKENLYERRKTGNSTISSKSSNNSPSTRRFKTENWSSGTSKFGTSKKFIIPTPKPTNDAKTNQLKRCTSSGKVPVGNQNRANPGNKSNAFSPRTSMTKNQRNLSKPDLVNGNSNRRKSEVDSENNKRNSSKDTSNGTGIPLAVSRSDTFLKDEPTILKKPLGEPVESEV